MNAVWKLDSITSTQKLVLLALADNANDRGECFPSMSMLARKTSLSDRAVRGAVRELETTGIVRSETRAGTSTLYRLRVQPRNDVPPSNEVVPRNVVPPTPEAGAALPADTTPERASDHPGTSFRPPAEEGAEPASGDPGTTFRPTPEPRSDHPGTSFRLTTTEPSTEPSPNHHHGPAARDAAAWASWWRDRHGIEMNACDARDRLRFMPLAKEWLAKGITFDQMDEAVEEARRTTKKPIGYLPAYAWQVLCNGQHAPRQKPMSAAAQTAAGFGTSRHHTEDAIDVVATERKVAPARLG